MISGIDATVLKDRAVSLLQQGKYDEAHSFFVRAIRISEKALGSDHLDVASLLNYHAILLEKQARYEEANLLYIRATNTFKRTLSQDHPDFAVALNNRAIVLEKQGKYTQAHVLYLHAIDIAERSLGSEHVQVAAMMNNRAVLLEKLGDYNEASPLFLRAISICERTQGRDHPNVAAMLNNRANLLQRQGNFDEAGLLCLRAINTSEKVLGHGHPDMARMLQNLAISLRKQGRYKEADGLLNRAIRQGKATLGLHHPDVAAMLNSLAISLEEQDHLEEANTLYIDAIKTSTAALGSGHPDIAATINNHAVLLEKQGKQNQVGQLYARAVDISQASLGDSHPQVAMVLGNLAAFLEKMGSYEEAISQSLRASLILERNWGPEHSEVAAMLNMTAIALHKQGNDNEAGALLLRAIKIEERVAQSGNPRIVQWLNNYAALMEEKGKFEEADSLYTRAVAIGETLDMNKSKCLPMVLCNQAGLLQKQGNDEEAEALLIRAIDICQESLGPEHSAAAAMRQRLAALKNRRMDTVEDAPKSVPALEEKKESVGVNRRWHGGIDVPRILEFLDCSDLHAYLSVSATTHVSVQKYLSTILMDYPSPEEGWTVPLEILTVSTSNAGKRILVAPKFGVTIESLGVDHDDERVERLNAVLVPPPCHGFLNIDDEQHFAIGPVLRCRWKGPPSSRNVPWTVRFPVDEEMTSLSAPSDVRILRREAVDQGQRVWQDLNAAVRPVRGEEVVECEIAQFSDIIPVIRKANACHRSEGYIKRRRPTFSFKNWTSKAMTVRVYNASTAALSFLQVPPSQTPTAIGRGAHITTGFSVGLGGESSNTFTLPRKVQQFGTLEPWEGNCEGQDEPAVSTLHPLPTTRLMRLVIYSVYHGNLEFTFHRIIDSCRAGTDVILLNDMLKLKYFGTRTMTGESGISDILEILKDVL